MPDYDLLLDDEVRAFLARAATFYPPDAVTLTVAEQRSVYDRMCADFDAGHPAEVSAQDRAFGGVNCRIYNVEGAKNSVVYYHGGGFVVGGLESHDSICAELAAGSGMRVVAVDYRLSPEHPHPEDFNDAMAAFEAICDTYSGTIVLAGDSAGGNLAAAVAHAQRNTGQGARISGCLLIYPGLGGAWTLPSYVEHADAPGLSTRDMQFYMNMRSNGQDKTGDATYAPLQDTDFSGLPPVVAITAQCDPLSSDGDAYVQELTKAGIPAIWREEKGLVHAYLRARHMSEKANASFARMIKSLKSLQFGQLPDWS
ncbi:MAG: alpha/beta hydrolase [Paracoccaceae bacterium]